MSDGEDQYQEFKDRLIRDGTDRLGLMMSWAFEDDPRRLAFTFARYKFAAKMLAGYDRVLEVGCGDGFASRIVRQTVNELVAIDFDSEFIANAKGNSSNKWSIDYRVHDMMAGPVEGTYDGAYSLDVLEHIDAKDEDVFIGNVARSLTDKGVFIVGMPSLESQTYASALSKEGHVNCKTQNDLTATMQRHFHTVFPFGMNDEVLHTGYGKMAHYLIALCVGPIR